MWKDLTKRQRRRRIKREKLFGWEKTQEDFMLSASSAAVFYRSKEWLTLRYAALNRYGRKCMSCGRSPKDGVVIQVDHIKPRYLYPEIALEMDNLQILCAECNAGKGIRWQNDLRVKVRKCGKKA